MKIEGFSQMLEQIHRERDIPKEALVGAIEAALLSACKKKFKENARLEAKIDEEGVARVYLRKTVASKVSDDAIEIGRKEARKIDPSAKVGGEVVQDVTPSDFGRLAAQTAKQVIIQRIREAEKESAFDEYNKKTGDLINGIVQRREKSGCLINIGRIETMLPSSEMIPGEYYRPKDQIKLYVVETRKTPKGPSVVVSRTHPGLVKKLFELEIPEISQGIIEIKGIAREAGRRSKIAVFSKDKNISAVGTCIGHMGSRIQNVVKELGSERVDIIEYNENPKTFISNSLSPAKPTSVNLNEEEHMAKVVVPQNQLSLAIGRDGQNVRLAAKLTGWKIDILSDEEAAKASETLQKQVGEIAATPSEKVAEPSEKVAEPSGKVKVHEVAKELGITSKKVIEMLKGMGVEAKAATSSIPKDIAAMLISREGSADKGASTEEK